MVSAKNIDIRSIQDPEAARFARVLEDGKEKQELLAEYEEFIIKRLKGLLRPMEIDDGKQEVIQRLTEIAHKGELEQVENFKAFMGGMIKNTAYEIIRRRKKHGGRHSPLEYAQEVPDQARSSLDEVIREQTYRRLMEKLKLGINHLTPRNRELVRRFYFEEMTSSEIGQSLGIHDEAVRQGLQRARASLRKFLERADITPEDVTIIL